MTTPRTAKRSARRQCVSGHVKTQAPLTFADIEKRLKLIDEGWATLDKLEDVVHAMKEHAQATGTEGQKAYNRAEIARGGLSRAIHDHMDDVLVAACLCEPANHHEALLAVGVAGYTIYSAVMDDSAKVDEKRFLRGIGILNGALRALQAKCNGDGTHTMELNWLRAGPNVRTLEEYLGSAKQALAEPISADCIKPSH